MIGVGLDSVMASLSGAGEVIDSLSPLRWAARDCREPSVTKSISIETDPP